MTSYDDYAKYVKYYNYAKYSYNSLQKSTFTFCTFLSSENTLDLTEEDFE